MDNGCFETITSVLGQSSGRVINLFLFRGECCPGLCFADCLICWFICSNCDSSLCSPINLSARQDHKYVVEQNNLQIRPGHARKRKKLLQMQLIENFSLIYKGWLHHFLWVFSHSSMRRSNVRGYNEQYFNALTPLQPLYRLTPIATPWWWLSWRWQ